MYNFKPGGWDYTKFSFNAVQDLLIFTDAQLLDRPVKSVRVADELSTNYFVEKSVIHRFESHLLPAFFYYAFQGWKEPLYLVVAERIVLKRYYEAKTNRQLAISGSDPVLVTESVAGIFSVNKTFFRFSDRRQLYIAGKQDKTDSICIGLQFDKNGQVFTFADQIHHAPTYEAFIETLTVKPASDQELQEWLWVTYT